MDTKYQQGLRREVSNMRRNGYSNQEIMRSLGVDMVFIQNTPNIPPVEREYEPDMGSINNTGGY